MTDVTNRELEFQKQRTRQRLAIGVIGASIVGIAVIAGLAIGMSGGEDRPETTRLVFTSMLPLLGTWVGTVLAFYFTRESLEAATQSTIETLRAARVTDQTPLAQVMIRRDEIDAVNFSKNESEITVRDLQQKMRATNRKRIPVFGPGNDVVSYVVHDSTLRRFVHAEQADPPDPENSSRTLQDLLDDKEAGSLVAAIAFVREGGVVGDARAEMRRVANANDVFVTTTGKRDGKVVGWLTNTLLASTD